MSIPTARHPRRGRPPAAPDLSTVRGRFAARLRQLRQRRYAGRAEFAEALQARGLDATVNTVASWETGHRVPSVDVFPALADALGVSLRGLLPSE